MGVVSVTFRSDVVDALELQFNGSAYGPLEVGKSDLELLQVHMEAACKFCILSLNFNFFFTWSMIDSVSSLQLSSS